MQATIHFKGNTYTIDLNAPIDISLPLQNGKNNPSAWYLKPPSIAPVTDGNWIGKVSQGSSVNFNNVWFNPHAHGTHTECVGHITQEFYSINNALKTFVFLGKLITIKPTPQGDDMVITKHHIEQHLKLNEVEALVIRTQPNTTHKKTKNYNNTNWPYLTQEAAAFIRECGVKHLLIDLPSVDKEKDEGKLLAHHAFWNHPKNTRLNATITELIYVPKDIPGIC